MVYSFLLLLLTFSFSQEPPSTRGNLILEIANIDTAKGTIAWGMYADAATFLDDDVFDYGDYTKVENSGVVRIVVPNVPYGTYGIGLYHDINDNEELDESIIGFPKEPYTFSNDVRAKWGKPSFEAAKFEFSPTNTTHRMHVRYWSEQ